MGVAGSRVIVAHVGYVVAMAIVITMGAVAVVSLIPVGFAVAVSGIWFIISPDVPGRVPMGSLPPRAVMSLGTVISEEVVFFPLGCVSNVCGVG